MGQITIYFDDETERLVKLHVKASGEWPADIAALFRKLEDDDLPDAATLRGGYGKVPREEL
jgi:hypothetical protein